MATTVIVQQQPMAANIPTTQREWSSGLFGCCEDVGACICALFCTPCNLCSIANRMEESALVPLCLQGGIMAMRTKLRIQYGISGTLCGDWAATTCCGPLAVCQMDRELSHVGL